MPLFFLISGYLASNNNFNFNKYGAYILRNAKRLLTPYLVTMLLICIWIWKFEIIKFRFDIQILPLLNLLWGSGDVCITEYGRLYVGPLWFLFAIFITRILFYGVQCFVYNIFNNNRDTLIIVFSTMISLLSIVLYDYISPLPWNILPGTAALIFYTIGYSLKNKSISWYVNLFLILCWTINIVYDVKLDLRSCEYGIFPLGILGACGGTLLIYVISKYLNLLSSRIKVMSYVANFFKWCGIGSLSILCMHSLDLMGGISEYISTILNLNSEYLKICLHFILPLSLTYLITKVQFIRNIFF